MFAGCEDGTSEGRSKAASQSSAYASAGLVCFRKPAKSSCRVTGTVLVDGCDGADASTRLPADRGSPGIAHGCHGAGADASSGGGDAGTSSGGDGGTTHGLHGAPAAAGTAPLPTFCRLFATGACGCAGSATGGRATCPTLSSTKLGFMVPSCEVSLLHGSHKT